MRKKSALHRYFFIISMSLLPACIAAQTPMNSFFCCEGHKPCLHFTSQSDLDYHNCHSHGIGCSSSPIVKTGSPVITPVSGLIIFGGLGALAGSLKDDKGKTHVAEGAAIGGGTGLLLGIAFGPKKHMGDFVHRKRSPFFSDIAFAVPGNRISLLLKF